MKHKVPKLTEEEKAARPWLFKKGVSGNKMGAPREVLIRIQENAKKATLLREKFLNTLQSRMATLEVISEREFEDGDEHDLAALKQRRILELLGPDINKLLTDSEARGFGAPKIPVDIEDRRKIRPEDMTDDDLAAIAAGTEEE